MQEEQLRLFSLGRLEFEEIQETCERDNLTQPRTEPLHSLAFNPKREMQNGSFSKAKFLFMYSSTTKSKQMI